MPPRSAKVDEVLAELEQILEGPKEPDGKEAPLPELWAVCYVPPAPGGVRRNCKNCVLWSAEEKCAVHDPKIKVTADAICGYWVYGAPQEKLLRLPKIQYVLPEYSALNVVPSGTSCDNCKWYQKDTEDEGICRAVLRKTKPATVHPRGCCNRWEQNGQKSLESSREGT